MKKMEARQKVRRAFDWIYDEHPYGASIVASWNVKEVPDQFFTEGLGLPPSAATNGKDLFYAKSFIDTLSIRETCDLILHEMMHVLLGHHFRFTGKKPRTWNVAADLALNDTVKEYYDPKGIIFQQGCFPGSDYRRPRRFDVAGREVPNPFANYPTGKSAEQYFELYNRQRLEEREKMRQAQKNAPKQETQKQKSQFNAPVGLPDESDEDEGAESESEGTEGSSVDNKSSKQTAGSSKAKGRASKPSSEKKSETKSQTAQSGEENESEEDSDERDDSATEGRTPRDLSDSESDSGDEDNESDVPHRAGDILPHPDSDDEEKLEEAKQEWEQQVAEGVNAAKSQGKLPGWAESLVQEYSHETPIDPEALLRQFMTEYAPTATSYSRPNRRTSYRTDVILPAQRARDLSPGVVLVDTSGSMDEEEMNQALSLIERTVRVFPHCTITLKQVDTRLIHEGERTFTMYDFPLRVPHNWMGRGGTNLAPAITEIGQERKFQWMIVVSDMEWHASQAIDPQIPTMWLVTQELHAEYMRPKFGQIVPLYGRDDA